MSQDNTLLDLDRVPTLDELREFFKKHDWSAAQISDPISRSIEKNETMEAIKKILDSANVEYIKWDMKTKSKLRVRNSKSIFIRATL